MGFNVAIDGPSGAGKSTLSKAVAQRMGFIYVDTGALYRTIGLYIHNASIAPENETDITKALSNIHIDIKFVDGEQRVILNGTDVSTDIRMHIISDYASKVSAIPAVRDFLLDMQRDFGRRYDVLMDGRDIGSVVLPDADVKIYLTASAEVRASRRYKELVEKGNNEITYETVLKDVIERDERDMNRAISPLKVADGAIIVDTSEFSFDESIEKLISVIEEGRK